MNAMDAADVIERFKKSGALLEGHFRLTSGLHSSGYLQCALVLQHPRRQKRSGRRSPHAFATCESRLFSLRHSVAS